MSTMITIEKDSGNGTEKHYSVTDAARLAGVSRVWMHELIKKGDVSRTFMWSGRRWVSKTEIDKVKRK